MTSSPGSMVSTSGPAPAACRRSTASGRPSLVVTSPDSSRLGRLADRRQPDVLRQRQPGIAVDAGRGYRASGPHSTPVSATNSREKSITISLGRNRSAMAWLLPEPAGPPMPRPSYAFASAPCRFERSAGSNDSVPIAATSSAWIESRAEIRRGAGRQRGRDRPADPTRRDPTARHQARLATAHQKALLSDVRSTAAGADW